MLDALFQQLGNVKASFLNMVAKPSNIETEHLAPAVNAIDQAHQDDQNNIARTMLTLDKQRQQIFDTHSGDQYKIANYNFGSDKVDDQGKGYGAWASNPEHVKQVKTIYTGSAHLNSPQLLDQEIKQNHPDSPITSTMIFKAAQKHDVDPILMYAEMRQDSGLGTNGVATKTKNPGNIGNTDQGGLHGFKSWDEGVDAVAQELAARELGRGLRLYVKRYK